MICNCVNTTWLAPLAKLLVDVQTVPMEQIIGFMPINVVHCQIYSINGLAKMSCESIRVWSIISHVTKRNARPGSRWGTGHDHYTGTIWQYNKSRWYITPDQVKYSKRSCLRDLISPLDLSKKDIFIYTCIYIYIVAWNHGQAPVTNSLWPDDPQCCESSRNVPRILKYRHEYLILWCMLWNAGIFIGLYFLSRCSFHGKWK